MKSFYDTFPTPLGNFSVALDADGVVFATAFGGLTELCRRFFVEEIVRDPVRSAAIRAEIGEYFTGERRYYTAKLNPGGTTFQRKVWAALQRIPFGETRSYVEMATEIGHPGAARAVGRANALNLICLIIPCHRVIGADGTLTGFAFGETIKRELLAHEKAPFLLRAGE